MLWLKEIKVSQYRNHAASVLQFSQQINCFCGKNGSGKTNLLDAIYYLSFTRSHFATLDQQLIKNGEDWYSIEGRYMRNDLEEIVRMSLQRGDKKSVKVNHQEVKRFADHIGQYPLVIITPHDIMLIHQGSEDRRKFLDGMISQTDKHYLSDLLAYNRTLEQRNKMLKDMAEHGLHDPTLFESYTLQLIRFGSSIHEKRKHFLETYIPVFRESYQSMSSSDEVVHIHYESDLNYMSYEQLLRDATPYDISAQRTTRGIHKDELEFKISDQPLKKYGSQGQQKSFIISLKLAQYASLKGNTGVKPLLLLDDIFEKLDGIRLEKLLHMIADDAFGQLFITDTHIERLKTLSEKIHGHQISYFMVEDGNINEI